MISVRPPGDKIVQLIPDVLDSSITRFPGLVLTEIHSKRESCCNGYGRSPPDCHVFDGSPGCWNAIDLEPRLLQRQSALVQQLQVPWPVLNGDKRHDLTECQHVPM